MFYGLLNTCMCKLVVVLDSVNALQCTEVNQVGRKKVEEADGEFVACCPSNQ